ncbi:MAG: peptidase domain-containing ABC transporter [Burkholderiales bacterium]|nr:peptidase domain-containing ABC transporter [Burkholderiales bacterium]
MLGSLCQINRVPFDPALVAQQYPPPHSEATFIEAATTLGFRVGHCDTTGRKLPELTFPFLARLRSPDAAQSSTTRSAPDASAEPDAEHTTDVAATGAEEVPTASLALVIKADTDRLLYFRAQSNTGETIASNEFAHRFEPVVLLVTHEAKSKTPDDDLWSHDTQKFGFRWFIPELLKHKPIWRDVLVGSLVLQLVGLTTPLFTQVIIDKVVVHQTQSTLIAIAAGLAMFLVFNSILTWLRQYFILHTGNRIDAVLGSQVFRHLVRLHLRYFEQRPTGTLIARLHGVETIRQFISGAAVTLFLDLPFLFVFLAVMFWYSWQLSFIAVTTVVLLAVLSIAITPLLRQRVNDQFLKGARNQAFLTEYVVGMETVKSLQMEPYLEKRYESLLADYLHAGFRARQLSNTTNTVANAIEQTQTLAILCVGALIVMQNEGFTIGMLVAFQMFASRMAQPMLRLASLWQEFQQADIAVKRLGDLMDAPAEPYALIPSRAPGGVGQIKISGLSFRYSEEHPYLYRNLSLTLKPGKLTVITGPSGCGKSTLAKLLQGFYPPEDGRIEIDNRDIRHLSANKLRQYYGVVPQETTLFANTVYENLAMASPHANFEDVINACRMAGIHDVIEKMPQGYQTWLGENGVGLSGGQKQRLAIARALLKRPKILIFDEATSGLDQATAEQFALTINQLKDKVTMLFIAHNLPRGLQVDDVFNFGASPASQPAASA